MRVEHEPRRFMHSSPGWNRALDQIGFTECLREYNKIRKPCAYGGLALKQAT